MRNFLVRRPGWMRFLFNPSQRLVGVFLVFILLPGLFLSVFALRVFRQEEQFVRQRTNERLKGIAKEIGLELDSEFKSWEENVWLATQSGTVVMDVMPDIVQQAFEEPGGGVLLSLDEGRSTPFPNSALLYVFNRPAATQSPVGRPSAGLVEAESLEIRQKDFRKAILSYQKMLESAKTEMRAMLLQRLARTLRKAGRIDEAADAFRELQRMDTVWLGGLPSDFIGRSELCDMAAERGEMSELADLSLALYRDLTGGRWFLDKPRYMYYSDRCRFWCQESQVQAGEFARLLMIEERKLALSRAAEQMLVDPKRIFSDGTSTHLGFWRSDPFAAVILSENFLRKKWWPRVILAQAEEIESVLYSSDGHVIFATTDLEVLPPFAVVQDMRIDGAPWRIQVWPKNPGAIQRVVRQRQNLFLVILVFVGALLVFGSYITLRIVRREMEISRMRVNFVSTVSHEFRSPLTGIRHLGEMLLGDRIIGRTKQRHYFRMIVQESERLTRLVENILDFSRMEEGQREYQFKPLNTSAWLRELVADFEAEIAADGVAVEMDIPEKLPLVSADSEALGSAVHNLLDNAVKYSPGEKTVWIAVEAEGGEIRIAIRDKGVGISESDRKHIFERFYRADGEISKQIKGAGLGLSLVRHIIEAHDGRIECESRLDEGSTFSIRLPTELKKGGGFDE